MKVVAACVHLDSTDREGRRRHRCWDAEEPGKCLT